MAAATAILASATAANASTWVYTGNNDDGKAVNVSANITLAAGKINVSLTNNGDGMIASNQAISGIFVTFNNGLTGVSALTQAGALYNLDGAANTRTAVAGSPSHWGSSVLTGGLRLWTLTGGKPNNLIAQAASKNFSNLNGGVGTHNPYILGTGTFVMDYTGPATEVASVKFLFGTNADSTRFAGMCAGCGGGTGVGGIPEPATWAMMIVGFGGVGAILRRRRLLAI